MNDVKDKRESIINKINTHIYTTPSIDFRKYFFLDYINEKYVFEYFNDIKEILIEEGYFPLVYPHFKDIKTVYMEHLISLTQAVEYKDMLKQNIFFYEKLKEIVNELYIEMCFFTQEQKDQENINMIKIFLYMIKWLYHDNKESLVLI